MSDAASKFLRNWVNSYIRAEVRDPETTDDTVFECVADAAEDGISREDLHAAAGGDLTAFIRKAIRETWGK
ncbi:MAG: hypothetical protein JJE37_00735 [Methyloceanibacter sp.]|jgi:hypothetical protein|nr:hypothetical protein [Methyloceanibacter sp.]